jgi:hypothetical protein
VNPKEVQIQSIPKFVLADVDRQTNDWQPAPLKIPVLGNVENVLVAFDDYVVGQEFIDKARAAAGSELVPVTEEQFRGLCRQCVELGVELVLTYITVDVFLTAGTATFVE